MPALIFILSDLSTAMQEQIFLDDIILVEPRIRVLLEPCARVLDELGAPCAVGDALRDHASSRDVVGAMSALDDRPYVARDVLCVPVHTCRIAACTRLLCGRTHSPSDIRSYTLHDSSHDGFHTYHDGELHDRSYYDDCCDGDGSPHGSAAHDDRIVDGVLDDRNCCRIHDGHSHHVAHHTHI